MKEKELIKEKMRSENIMREVLRNQIKEQYDYKKQLPANEVEAFLFEKYKHDNKLLKKVIMKADEEADKQSKVIHRHVLIDQTQLHQSK